MSGEPWGFAFTEEMRRWIHSTRIEGPCCVMDRWTWGRGLVTPVERTYSEAGVVKTFRANDWSTIEGLDA